MGQAKLPNDVLKAVRGPLILTHIGMAAEQLARAFWPVWSVLAVVLGALMLGVQDHLSVLVLWIIGAVALLAVSASFVWGLRAFRWPSRFDAMARLDATMKGRPIQTVLDKQAIGADDPASLAVWQAHQARMRARLSEARTAQPDLRVSRADPFALRYVALLTLCVGLLFGSLLKVGSVTAMGGTGLSSASGPTWEGWVEPPGYTRLPSLYLNDITTPELNVAQGSRITLRMYGQEGALTVVESVSGNPISDENGATATAQEFTVKKSGRLAIDGEGGRIWEVAMAVDAVPSVQLDGEIDVTFEGESTIPFSAVDDYGVVEGSARIVLALDQVERRYLLSTEPEARPAIERLLPLPIAGNRADFTESMVENFSQHPWANLPVSLELSVEDAQGQTGLSEPTVITLPGRRFFEPMAAALIEQRRALLWSRQNANDVALILRAISYRPDGIFRSEDVADRMTDIIDQLEEYASLDMTVPQQDELAQDLWDLAEELEEGDLADALERLQRAQDRLNEAMKNGASDAEIAELMQELRDATDEYMRQLAQQSQREQEQTGESQGMDQNSMQMSQNDLQRMMDRIQELMEEGRMAEAQEALEQLREMLENMEVTQGQGGDGPQSPGEQAMEGLAETLRDQQELSDESFRDLQEQFNPGGRPGQQPPQGQQPGEQQGEQQGQQPGEGQQGGQGDEQSQQGQPNGQSTEQSLAQRQRALRDEVNRQRSNLPGSGTEAGERARESLGRAEDAMEGAEQALRDGDLAEAIGRQSEAMEALREGMRDLGEAMAQQQSEGQGEQGTAQGGDPNSQRDPLGRNAGTDGQVGTEESLLQGEDVYRRARELLDEIRRRSGEGERPDVELEYLERLLDRF